jgi:hypothetical protein
MMSSKSFSLLTGAEVGCAGCGALGGALGGALVGAAAGGAAQALIAIVAVQAMMSRMNKRFMVYLLS